MGQPYRAEPHPDGAGLCLVEDRHVSAARPRSNRRRAAPPQFRVAALGVWRIASPRRLRMQHITEDTGHLDHVGRFTSRHIFAAQPGDKLSHRGSVVDQVDPLPGRP